jgi:hypothetical protein
MTYFCFHTFRAIFSLFQPCEMVLLGLDLLYVYVNDMRTFSISTHQIPSLRPIDFYWPSKDLRKYKTIKRPVLIPRLILKWHWVENDRNLNYPNYPRVFSRSPTMSKVEQKADFFLNGSIQRMGWHTILSPKCRKCTEKLWLAGCGRSPSLAALWGEDSRTYWTRVSGPWRSARQIHDLLSFH